MIVLDRDRTGFPEANFFWWFPAENPESSRTKDGTNKTQDLLFQMLLYSSTIDLESMRRGHVSVSSEGLGLPIDLESLMNKLV